jgi:hypothetical protein
MNKTLTALTTLTTLAMLALLTACGGGGDSSSSADGYTVSGGTVQKGPLVQGSSITVNTLNSTTWQPSGASYTFEITNNLGNFSAASTVFNAQYAESTALGYYFDELKGVVSNDMVYLRGLSDLRNDKAINLNVLTDMVRARIRVLTTRATSKLTFPNARLQAQKELLTAFYIYNSADLLPSTTTGPANFNEIDLSKTRNADQILAAISGVITQMGQNGSGINLALSRLEMDLADDGLINNSPNYAASNVTRLSSAETATNFTAVADNLNAFYGNANFTGTSVGQWIDSSGGVDRVIDRYKFTATGTLNVESKSPFYLAGSDDVGQCMSVDAGKLYRKASGAASATLVTTATVKAVAGDQYQIGLTPTAPGPISGFIQRSAPPVAGGACPTVLPSTGLTRIVKYLVTTLGIIANNFDPSYAIDAFVETPAGNIVQVISQIGSPYASTLQSTSPTTGLVWKFSESTQSYSYGGGTKISQNKNGDIFWARDSRVSKVSSSGAEVWTYSAPGGNIYFRTSAATDGGVFAARPGTSHGLIKITSSGQLAWTSSFSITGRGSVYDIKAAIDGGLYVSGTVDYGDGLNGVGITDRSAFISKISSTGAVVWTRLISQQAVGVMDAFGFGLQEAPDGSIYVGGQGLPLRPAGGSATRFIDKFSSAGDLLWSINVQATPATLAVDDSSVYCFGTVAQVANSIVTKLKSDGSFIRDVALATGGGSPNEMVISKSGNILASGIWSNGSGFFATLSNP